MREEKNDIRSKILEASGSFKVKAGHSKDESWDKLQKRIYRQKHGNLILIGTMTRYVVAASAAILILVAFTFLNVKQISTGKGENRLVALPDESTVLLNASSSISYNPWFWHFNREVELNGEAFFQVEKGAEFKVWSGEKSVTVLGTSFNIKSRENTYQVSCFTGKVLVENENNREVILTRGEETKSAQGELPKSRFNESRTATWRTGDFYFESTALENVMKELERQFDVQVIFMADADRIYTGYFNTQSLEGALERICTPMGMQYRLEDQNRIIIE